MSDTLLAALISGGVGLVAGLVPFWYLVRKDREARKAEEVREVERQREQRASVAKTYLAFLGKVLALLGVLRVDAANADDLLEQLSEANAELQGWAQGELLGTFGAQSPVVWADRACRKLVRKAVDLAHDARAERRHGECALATQNEIRALITGHIDYGGPRELMRWATDAAVGRWPEPVTSFEGQQWLADQVALLAGIDPFRPRPS